jgi:hypothetical protein
LKAKTVFGKNNPCHAIVPDHDISRFPVYGDGTTRGEVHKQAVVLGSEFKDHWFHGFSALLPLV